MRASIVTGVVFRGGRIRALALCALLGSRRSRPRARVRRPRSGRRACSPSSTPPTRSTSYPDPIEPVNRATLGFNEQLDRFLIAPISRGYSAVMPDQAELAVRRVFRNLGEPISFLNHTLRLEPRLAGETLARFG